VFGGDCVTEHFRRSVSWQDVSWQLTNFIRTRTCEHHHRHHSIGLTWCKCKAQQENVSNKSQTVTCCVSKKVTGGSQNPGIDPWCNKTAELSQRRPRNAPNYMWVPWKVLRVLTTHPATFPEICNGLLFRSILRMSVQNLKFVALPVPETIGVTQKIWATPVYAHAPFYPKFLIGFCSHGPSEYICQIWRS